MEISEEIKKALQQGRVQKVRQLVEQAVDDGVAAQAILDNALIAGMDELGEKFKNNEVFIPELMLAANCMNQATEILKRHLAKDVSEKKGTVVIGTVKGDRHDIGKNLVKMMLEGKGLNVVDLGVDVSAEEFLSAAQERNAHMIALSALLTTTMVEMKRVVDLRNSDTAKTKLKIIVGGAPVTEEFSKSIGADYYADDAATAAQIAKDTIATLY